MKVAGCFVGPRKCGGTERLRTNRFTYVHFSGGGGRSNGNFDVVGVWFTSQYGRGINDPGISVSGGWVHQHEVLEGGTPGRQHFPLLLRHLCLLSHLNRVGLLLADVGGLIVLLLLVGLGAELALLVLLSRCINILLCHGRPHNALGGGAGL